MPRTSRPQSLGLALVIQSAALVAVSVSAPVVAQVSTVDSALPAYAQSGAVSGAVRVAGNAAATALFADVCEAFRKVNPAVTYTWDGDQSQQAAAALIAGKADIAALGRPMSAKERADFERTFGQAPIEIVFALDALAVVVPKQSPVQSLTTSDVAALFGANPSGRATARQWSDVGVTDAEYGKLSVEAHASRTIDDLAGEITSKVLGGGELRADIRNQRTLGAIVTGAAKSGSVGIVSPSAVTGGVRIVPIAPSTGAAPVAPSSETIANSTYPYGRKLYAYVNASKGLPPHVAELFRFTLSREGQRAVASRGGIPVTAAMAEAERRKLGR
jgi:phosphate transport system substrate-binding protein